MKSPDSGPEFGREDPIVGIDDISTRQNAILAQRLQDDLALRALKQTRGFRIEMGPNAHPTEAPAASRMAASDFRASRLFAGVVATMFISKFPGSPES